MAMRSIMWIWVEGWASLSDAVHGDPMFTPDGPTKATDPLLLTHLLRHRDERDHAEVGDRRPIGGTAQIERLGRVPIAARPRRIER